MVNVKVSGHYTKAQRWLNKLLSLFKKGAFEKYGQMGVEALRKATPKDTGKTSSSWTYDVSYANGGIAIIWYNTNVNDGQNIAILIQYGHGLQQGGFVYGVDYVNPAMKDVFRKIADDAWREVKNR